MPDRWSDVKRSHISARHLGRFLPIDIFSLTSGSCPPTTSCRISGSGLEKTLAPSFPPQGNSRRELPKVSPQGRAFKRVACDFLDSLHRYSDPNPPTISIACGTGIDIPYSLPLLAAPFCSYHLHKEVRQGRCEGDRDPRTIHLRAGLQNLCREHTVKIGIKGLGCVSHCLLVLIFYRGRYTHDWC